jgi:hypothetical protein
MKGKNMAETTRVPRVETPTVSTPLSPSIPRRNEEVGALKTPKNDLSSALRALVKYYDEEGQFSPEKMDPQTGGLFEEEFLLLLETDDRNIIDALRDAGFIVVRSKPRTQQSTTVWPTGKGLVEGRKKDPNVAQTSSSTKE